MSNGDIQVILNELKNLKEQIDKTETKNDKAHRDLLKGQRYTNGNVRRLQIWKATLAGAIAVMGIIGGYFIKDYVSTRDMTITLQNDFTHLDAKANVILNNLAK